MSRAPPSATARDVAGDGRILCVCPACPWVAASAGAAGSGHVHPFPRRPRPPAPPSRQRAPPTLWVRPPGRDGRCDPMRRGSEGSAMSSISTTPAAGQHHVGVARRRRRLPPAPAARRRRRPAAPGVAGALTSKMCTPSGWSATRICAPPAADAPTGSRTSPRYGPTRGAALSVTSTTSRPVHQVDHQCGTARGRDAQRLARRFWCVAANAGASGSAGVDDVEAVEPAGQVHRVAAGVDAPDASRGAARPPRTAGPGRIREIDDAQACPRRRRTRRRPRQCDHVRRGTSTVDVSSGVSGLRVRGRGQQRRQHDRQQAPAGEPGARGGRSTGCLLPRAATRSRSTRARRRILPDGTFGIASMKLDEGAPSSAATRAPATWAMISSAGSRPRPA